MPNNQESQMADKTASPQTRRPPDPELQTLGRLARLLDDLDEDVRERCIYWLCVRYECWANYHPSQQKPTEAKP
jgi:hypothetical protein